MTAKKHRELGTKASQAAGQAQKKSVASFGDGSLFE